MADIVHRVRRSSRAPTGGGSGGPITLTELVRVADEVIKRYAQHLAEIDQYDGDRDAARKGLFTLWEERLQMAVAVKTMYGAVFESLKDYAGQPLSVAVRMLTDRALSKIVPP